ISVEESRDTSFNNTALLTNNGDRLDIGNFESSTAVDSGQLESESHDYEDRTQRKRDSRSRSRDRDRHHHKRHREKHRKKSRSQSRDRGERRRRSRSRDRKRDRRSRDRDRDSYDDHRNGARRPSHDDRSSQRRDLSGRDYELQQHQATFGPVLPPAAPTSMMNVGFNTSGDAVTATDFNFMKQPGTPNSQGKSFFNLQAYSSVEETGRKRKSRWSKENEKAFVPGMPTMLPSNLTDEQRNAYLCKPDFFSCSCGLEAVEIKGAYYSME
uniref:Uncharacterized protein n=1 Tax=Romanomermis culicivorax TaxID=13658 RepID=A0A915HWZ3_ROMCU